MSKTYITDITHFLDDEGNIPSELPAPARKLASFQVLIIDAVTPEFPSTTSGVETGIRCRSAGCHGNIIGALDAVDDPIHWYCLDCGSIGTISNWQGTKWDNRHRSE